MQLAEEVFTQQVQADMAIADAGDEQGRIATDEVADSDGKDVAPALSRPPTPTGPLRNLLTDN